MAIVVHITVLYRVGLMVEAFAVLSMKNWNRGFMYCTYYHVRFVKKDIWFVVGALRAEDNVVFERAFDGESELFEFFVPPGREPEFLSFMDCLSRRGHVLSLEQKPNRFQSQA